MFGDIGGGDWFLLIVRWLHAIGALAWLGGSIFFAAVLRPLAKADPGGVGVALTSIGQRYRDLVDVAIVAILVSGIIMMFDRLTGDDATVAWVIVLAVKLTIAGWMFYLVWRLRRAGFQQTPGPGLLSRLSWLLGYNAIVAFGVIVFFLATLLRELIEKSITS